MAISLDLGAVDEVERLYSYPNNFNEVGFLSQTLEETVTTWLSSTLKRDGSNGQLQVIAQGGRLLVQYAGADEGAYAQALPAYLDAGRLALKASVYLNTSKRWLYNWRFLLPHGLAMTQHRTVQLLHFPPDYVLERDQDYLLAHTTTRWAELLVENGAPAATTDQYQTIVDIAPIAAPSNAGPQLEGVYPSYTAYIQALLKLWLPIGAGVRPMVAFGSPVRQWLKSIYNIDVPVLSVARLQVGPGLSAPVLGANHPSFIYNAKTDPSGAAPAVAPAPAPPPDKGSAMMLKIMRIMQQDLTAAGWQVTMAADPTADPAAVLADMKTKWADPTRQGRICELSYQQVFDQSPASAASLCAVLPTAHVGLLSLKAGGQLSVLDAEIDALRDALGALDGREPDQIPPI